MGRVIKGSPASPERYTVAIPDYAPPAPAAGFEDRAFNDPFAAFDADADAYPDSYPDTNAASDVPFPTAFEPGPAAQPAFDLDAAAAQAQELIDEAARSADALVAEAQEQARGLIDDATQQAQRLAEEARRHGHDDGHAAGLEAAHDEMTAMLSTMRELIEATRTERHGLIGSAESELVRLAVGIAERVLHQQIALDHGVVVEMAKAAIARIVDREKITVRVNPADIDRMREHRESLLALGDVKTMRVVEDQRVDRGGVIIETDAGSIDAKISTQFAEVRKLLHIVDDVPAPIPAMQIVDDSALTAARAS